SASRPPASTSPISCANSTPPTASKPLPSPTASPRDPGHDLRPLVPARREAPDRSAPRAGEPFGGGHHAGAAPGVLGRVAVVGAGEHAGDLRRGHPPRGQPDDHEHEVLR